MKFFIVIFIVFLLSCAGNNENQVISYDDYKIAFLQHDVFIAMSVEDFFRFDIHFFSNMPDVDAEIFYVKLLYNGNEVFHISNPEISVFAQSEEIELTGYEIIVSHRNFELPPDGLYIFNQIAFFIGETEYMSDIGKFQIEVERTEIVDNIFINESTSFTLPPIDIRPELSLSFTPNIGDIRFLGLDFGYLTERIFVYPSGDMLVQEGAMQRLRISYDIDNHPSANLILNPWIIFEYNGEIMRVATRNMVSLISFTTEDVIADIVENSLIITRSINGK